MPASLAFSGLPGLTRCKALSQYYSLGVQGPNEDEGIHDGDSSEDGSDQATPTQSRPFNSDDGHPLKRESTSLFDELKRCPRRRNIVLGMDFGFDVSPLRLSPKINFLEDDAKFSHVQAVELSPKIDVIEDDAKFFDVHAVELSPKISIIEDDTKFFDPQSVLTSHKGRCTKGKGRDEPVSGKNQFRRKAGTVRYDMDKVNSGIPEKSSMKKEEFERITESYRVLKIFNNPTQSSQCFKQETRLGCDQRADAAATLLSANSKPPIPEKSSRRKITQYPIDRNNGSSAPKGVGLHLTKIANTHGIDYGAEDDGPARHLPNHDAFKLPNPSSSYRPKHFQRVFSPSSLPKLHPRVLAAEARIASYKASPAFAQRNTDLHFINARNQARKSALKKEDGNDDEETVTGKLSRVEKLYKQAMDRITEMSVNGSFGAFLKDVKFVRMYKEEVKLRNEKGLAWEGWMILADLRKMGVISSM